MKKVKIIGIHEHEEQTEFIVDKSSEFIPFVRKLVKDITGEKYFELFPGECGAECHSSNEIEDWTDRYHFVKRENFELGIFVGKNKIILILRSPSKIRKKFVQMFSELCKWKK